MAQAPGNAVENLWHHGGGYRSVTKSPGRVMTAVEWRHDRLASASSGVHAEDVRTEAGQPRGPRIAQAGEGEDVLHRGEQAVVVVHL